MRRPVVSSILLFNVLSGCAVTGDLRLGGDGVCFDCLPTIDLCGNGQLDEGEACDGNCPTECTPSSEACTKTELLGSAEDCSAQCTMTSVSSCVNGDACCPSGCTAEADSDCVTLTTLRLAAGLTSGTAAYEGKTFVPLAPYAVGTADPYTHTGMIDVLGTLNDELYLSELYGNGGMQFRFPVENGAYTVHLHNAELNSPTRVRIFSVTINSTLVVNNWNIAVSAGGFDRAELRSFDVDVTNAMITIDFIQGASDCPKICGIEILPRGVPPLVVDPAP